MKSQTTPNCKFIRFAKAISSRAWLVSVAAAFAVLLCLSLGNNLRPVVASSNTDLQPSYPTFNAKATKLSNRILTSKPVEKLGWSTLLPAPPTSAGVQTCADAACNTPQTNFHVGDTVFVQVSGVTTGGSFPRILTWGAPDSTIVQSATISSDPQSGSR